jgi:hypothetical protein
MMEERNGNSRWMFELGLEILVLPMNQKAYFALLMICRH